MSVPGFRADWSLNPSARATHTMSQEDLIVRLARQGGAEPQFTVIREKCGPCNPRPWEGTRTCKQWRVTCNPNLRVPPYLTCEAELLSETDYDYPSECCLSNLLCDSQSTLACCKFDGICTRDGCCPDNLVSYDLGCALGRSCEIAVAPLS